MCQSLVMIPMESHLLGDISTYEEEIYKYKNNYRKNKIEKQIDGLKNSIKRFTYRACELISELDNMYDFVIQYYARYILLLVHTYQKYDKDILNETYTFINNKCSQNKELLIGLKKDYNEMIESKKDEIKKMITVSKITQQFISQFEKVYDSVILVQNLHQRDLYEQFVELIDQKEMVELFNFAFDHALTELFIFLYTFCRLSFDYCKLIVQKKSEKTNEFDMNVTNMVAVNTGCGYIGTSFFVAESKELIDIYDKMIYIKRYSRMYHPYDYRFNTKYIAFIRFYTRDYINFDDVFGSLDQLGFRVAERNSKT